MAPLRNEKTGTYAHPSNGHVVASKSNGADRQWTFTQVGGGAVTIRNQATGEYIVIPKDASTGTPLQASANAANPTRWLIQGNVIALADNPGFVMDLSGGRAADSTQVILYERKGTNNQQWSSQ